MAAHWVVKTEPSAYSYDDLEREGRTVWDGVRNAQALIHLRAMAKGEEVLVYHTGDIKAIVGLSRVERSAYPDPNAADPKQVVVDLKAVRRLDRPVSLAEIKAAPALSDLALVRQGRLSVLRVPADAWRLLLAMSGKSAP